MLTWKIVVPAEASVLYIYIDKSINEINIINIYLSNYVKYYKNDSADMVPSLIDWMLRNALREDV